METELLMNHTQRIDSVLIEERLRQMEEISPVSEDEKTDWLEKVWENKTIEEIEEIIRVYNETPETVDRIKNIEKKSRS